jgi:Protein of unknown function (DUF1571)
MTLRAKPIIAAVCLAFVLAGCAQQRFTGLHGDPETASGPPKPASPLFIPSPPSVAASKSPSRDDTIEQASYAPRRDAKPTPGEVKPEVVEHPLGVLYERAAQRLASMDTYIYRLKRREVVNGRKQPEELIRVAVRREPFSVHLKWLGIEGKGREAIYAKGKYKDEMQILLAGGDMFPLSPAGMRVNLAPNDPLAQGKSRYPITETGFASLIARFGQLAAAIEKGDTRGGTAKYLGRVERPEFTKKLEAVHQVLPANSDPLLPKGGQRWWYFDADTGLPALVIAHDPTGEVEYYCHDNVIYPAHLDDEDFDPVRMWRK